MRTITIFGRTHEIIDLLIIAAYLVLLLILAVLIWEFISPILAVIISGALAYLLDLRKLFQGKK